MVQQPDGGFVDGHAAEGVKELVGNEGEAGVGPCEGVGIVGGEEGVDGGGGERRRGGILGGGVEARGWRPLVLAQTSSQTARVWGRGSGSSVATLPCSLQWWRHGREREEDEKE